MSPSDHLLERPPSELVAALRRPPARCAPLAALLVAEGAAIVAALLAGSEGARARERAVWMEGRSEALAELSERALALGRALETPGARAPEREGALELLEEAVGALRIALAAAADADPGLADELRGAGRALAGAIDLAWPAARAAAAALADAEERGDREAALEAIAAEADAAFEELRVLAGRAA